MAFTVSTNLWRRAEDVPLRFVGRKTNLTFDALTRVLHAGR